MKKILTLVALVVATYSTAAPLKISSFQVKIVSPEADVELATLQTVHNGDPEKVTLRYTLSDKRATITKYGDYDIINMGEATTTSINVIASDGVNEARSTYLYTRTDRSVPGYYTNRDLWYSVVAKSFQKRAAFKFVEADPNLPNVLIIGTSISIGYTPFVRSELEGIANVYRIAENSQSTDKGMESIDHWLSDVKWDVIHVNWGLHDLKYTISKESQDVPLDRYESNLRTLLKRMQSSGAKIVWAHTSYVPEGVTPRRDQGDDAKYNAVAERVIKEFKGIIIDDQYKLTKDNPELQSPHNVHFTQDGYKLQAEQAAKYIKQALK
ncbi:MAG: SGNH/GDSL hydrolase family protein [Rikenellaceae bacterium]